LSYRERKGNLTAKNEKLVPCQLQSNRDVTVKEFPELLLTM